MKFFVLLSVLNVFFIFLLLFNIVKNILVCDKLFVKIIFVIVIKLI